MARNRCKSWNLTRSTATTKRRLKSLSLRWSRFFTNSNAMGSTLFAPVPLTQSDLQKAISEFDKNNGGENRDSRPSPHGT
jgi:hypothetical protein